MIYMHKTRKAELILTRQPTTEGAGVRLYRVFGYNEAPTFDPFLMLDDFRSDAPEAYLKGFPWHPHRGIETITYVLKGDVEHGDSLGNKGMISSGDVQWMTAGSGIIHQEMPKGDSDGAMHGFQLWANLPADQKMIDPKYRDIKSDSVPEILVQNGVKIKIIAGSINGAKGPMDDIVIDPEFFDCTLPAGQSFVHETDASYTAFIYVIGGKGETDQKQIQNGNLILFGKGDHFKVTASDGTLRFLVLTGKPLKEPVAWRGPIVMNTREELETAFREYRDGTFIKSL